MKTWKLALASTLLALSTLAAQAAVDLNTADAKALEKLPGIGPAKAQAIVEHRSKNGAYKNIEDLKKVDGIGNKTFESLKSEISVTK
ncbi:MAG: ComEA family DNA-binding protein [Panacagrimonas sp.]|jgi:competence protein ComEA|nr:helix-hairpin-helix domain-containing protein [Panacagrimonas sp.]MCC2657096.1 ComEA family DNA-binding protein [Panacagrimonas sp.]